METATLMRSTSASLSFPLAVELVSGSVRLTNARIASLASVGVTHVQGPALAVKRKELGAAARAASTAQGTNASWEWPRETADAESPRRYNWPTTRRAASRKRALLC